MSQIKAMLRQLGRRPGDSRVATLTFLAELPGMDIWLSVTAIASPRRPDEDLVLMAVYAAQFGVGRFQGIGVVMDKINNGPRTIVAAQAVLAMLDAVFGHQLAVGVLVAGGAAYLVFGEAPLRVAILADHRRAVEARFVQAQTEAAECLMIDIFE